MKGTTLLIAALPIAVAVAAATPAFAMRDPGAGAMPGNGMGLYQYAPPAVGRAPLPAHMPAASTGTGMALYTHGGRRPSAPSGMRVRPGIVAPRGIGQNGLNNQYADGVNLYEYVRSEPIGGLDPSGLNRYISSNGLHGYFVIDEWDEDCCKVTGYWRVDFVPNADMKTTSFGYWFNLAAALTIGGGSHITVVREESKPASISTTIKSTCKGDKKLLKELRRMSLTAGKEGFYWSALWRNCWFFTWEWAYKYDDE